MGDILKDTDTDKIGNWITNSVPNNVITFVKPEISKADLKKNRKIKNRN